MKKVNAKNTVESLNINEETICVRYNKELDDYMFQYFWIKGNEDTHLDDEVVKTINAFKIVKCTEKEIFQSMDVVQVG
jgi:nuclear transport factor 2 (NTF2) superfamily protein